MKDQMLDLKRGDRWILRLGWQIRRLMDVIHRARVRKTSYEEITSRLTTPGTEWGRWDAPSWTTYEACLHIFSPFRRDDLSPSRCSGLFCLTRGPFIGHHNHSNLSTHNPHLWLHNNRRYIITIGESSIWWKYLPAGTAGLVVANRLTEDPKITVLVLEAGVRWSTMAIIILPSLYLISQWWRSHSCHCTIPCTNVNQWAKFITPSPFIINPTALDTPYDWNYTVVPQKGMHDRTFPYPQGRLLGGSSSASECGGI